jgi:hypothetical protein
MGNKGGKGKKGGKGDSAASTKSAATTAAQPAKTQRYKILLIGDRYFHFSSVLS